VIDVQMGVIDGIQMLAMLNRGYPNVQKVALTGFVSEKHRAACLNNGAELFLEKPHTPAGWRTLYAVLNELIRLRPEEGFRGVLRKVGLQDVIQMECLARSSSVLEISNAKIAGKIFIESGQIVHAQVGEEQGEAAFNRLLALGGGQFAMKQFVEPPQRSISGSWEFLVMEAARKSDEAKEAAEPAPAAGEVAGDLRQLAAAAAVPELLPVVQPLLPPGVATRPRVDEMLVSSGEGEVLYQWQCPNPEFWISFFEFASQRGQRLAKVLPLGNFDRLEIQSAGTRIVVAVSEARGLLVKSHQEALTPP
jgi:CheY-like chemotaxis protein